MPATLTVVGSISHGHVRKIFGTLTASAGETTASVSGLDLVTDYELKLDSDLAGLAPKAVYSNPTLTWTFDDLPHAMTGTWSVEGR